MKQLFLSLLLWVPFASLHACLNGEHITLHTGTPLYFDRSGGVPLGHSFITQSNLRKELRDLDQLYKKTGDIDYLSDKGLVLIVLGEYAKAIALYEQIEKQVPGRYSTASNMGTTYELMGNNELALKWIQKAVAINPASHKGSEWIHVNILKYKLSGDTALTSRDLIGIDFGTGVYPQSSLSQKKLQKLADAMFYQLNERVSFIKPKDKIIAQLFFDYANINILINDNPTARSSFEKASEYGLDRKLMEVRYNNTLQRIKALDSMIIHEGMAKLGYGITAPLKEEKPDYSWLIWGSISSVFLVCVSVIFFKRKRKTEN